MRGRAEHGRQFVAKHVETARVVAVARGIEQGAGNCVKVLCCFSERSVVPLQREAVQ